MTKDTTIRVAKIAFMIIVGLAIWFSAPPDGLKPIAWKYFSAYVVAILGIMLSPYNSPVVMLAVLGVYGLAIGPKTLLTGYASTTTWQVFAAFMISVAFVSTGLGKRIAYLLIRLFGRTSLGLAYSLAFTDLTLGMAIPSTTARAGGVVFPIFNNVARTLGSTVEDGTSRKLASYLNIVSYHMNLVTASVFLTGMAPNVQIAEFAKDILGVQLEWLTWAKMMIVPGIVLTLLIPAVMYFFYTPEIKKIDNYKEIAHEGLQKMGPMQIREKFLLFFFIGAVALWATTGITKFNATAVAMMFLACCLVFGYMSWDEVRESNGAWNTLVWYGAIIGLSSQLSGAGFFKWFAKFLQTHFNFVGIDPVMLLLILMVGGLVIRYMFASSSVFTTSMMPVMYTIGLVGQAPLFPLAMLCAACNGFGAMLTNYGGACGPVLFGYGHVPMKKWWFLGTISTICCVLVYFLIGIPWWHMIGMWH